MKMKYFYLCKNTREYKYKTVIFTKLPHNELKDNFTLGKKRPSHSEKKDNFMSGRETSTI